MDSTNTRRSGGGELAIHKRRRCQYFVHIYTEWLSGYKSRGARRDFTAKNRDYGTNGRGCPENGESVRQLWDVQNVAALVLTRIRKYGGISSVLREQTLKQLSLFRGLKKDE